MFKPAVIILAIATSCFLASGEVKFIYYSGPGVPTVQLQNIQVAMANIDPTKVVKVICHGALADSSVSWYNPLINGYLGKGHQVIAVDWGTYSNIFQFASKIDVVGNLLGQLIVNIRNGRGVPLGNIHIVGHSVGAHIAGYAGRHVSAIFSLKIGRITSLDGSSASLTPSKQTLSPTDAKFVDEIHTGGSEKQGEANFFPNGGNAQPGCSSLQIDCSHNRAPIYFIESVNSNAFVARKCGSMSTYQARLCNGNEIAIMGEGCPLTSSGDYYLETNSASPFAKG